jgi:hypothetical protein
MSQSSARDLGGLLKRGLQRDSEALSLHLSDLRSCLLRVNEDCHGLVFCTYYSMRCMQGSHTAAAEAPRPPTAANPLLLNSHGTDVHACEASARLTTSCSALLRSCLYMYR